MKRKLKVPKERNPFVAHLATKRSGPHGKTNKALRKADKQVIRNKLNEDP
jgi:hypothetical protein